MAIHIGSENVESGTRYNGVWSLSAPIKGTYTVVGQSLKDQLIPWATLNNRNLNFDHTVDEDLHNHEVVLLSDAAIEDGLLTAIDMSEIAEAFQYRFDELGDEVVDTWSVTVTLQNQNTEMKWVWSEEVTIHWDDSSIAKLFGKSGDETGTEFIVSTKHITPYPKLLYVLIEESDSSYSITSQESEVKRPSLIFSTQDSELLNQNIVFGTSTDELTVQLYLINMTNSPIELTASWELTLMRK